MEEQGAEHFLGFQRDSVEAPAQKAALYWRQPASRLSAAGNLRMNRCGVQRRLDASTLPREVPGYRAGLTAQVAHLVHEILIVCVASLLRSVGAPRPHAWARLCCCLRGWGCTCLPCRAQWCHEGGPVAATAWAVHPCHHLLGNPLLQQSLWMSARLLAVRKFCCRCLQSAGMRTHRKPLPREPAVAGLLPRCDRIQLQLPCSA